MIQVTKRERKSDVMLRNESRSKSEDRIFDELLEREKTGAAVMEKEGDRNWKFFLTFF